MSASLTPQKSRTTIFTIKSVSSNAVAKSSAPLNVSGKWGGVLKIRFGRTSTSSIGATEIRLEGTGLGHAGGDSFWVPIVAWTNAGFGTAASQNNVGSTPAANAIALDGTWTGITAADGLVFLFDTNTVTRSEWARVASVTGSILTFQDTLTNVHTASTNKVVDQAEEWSIPVSFEGEESVRLVVDNAKNSVAVPVVVHGILVNTDAVFSS